MRVVAAAHRSASRLAVEFLEDRTLASFSAPVSYASGGTTPHGMAVVDVNRDGNADMIVANSAASGTVSVFLGMGDGSFGPRTDFAAGAYPDSVKAADVNGDSIPDLVVGGSYNGTVSVMIGGGDGSFAAATPIVASGFAGRPFALADMSGDGKTDIAYVNTAGLISVSLGNGDGTFGAAANYGAGASPNCVVSGDFDGDGRLDLAAPNIASLGYVSVLMNAGNGSYQPAKSYYAFSAPFAMAAGDFNHDGHDDLIVANSYTSSAVTVLNCNPDGTFQQPVTYQMPYAPFELETGDFNHDGNMDVAERAPNAVEVQLGRGDGGFYPAATTVTASGPIGYAASGDFNNDGSTDYVAPTNTGTIVVYNNANNDRVSIGTAVGFRMSTPTTMTANSQVPATVTAVDANGNVATDFVGTVYFSSSDPNARNADTAAYTFTAADAGTHTFIKSLVLTTVGPQTFTVSTPFMSAAANSINVTPAATRLSVSAPASAKAGDTVAVTVSATDALGNVAVGYTGTVRLSSNDLQAVLPPNYTFTAADNGTATFNVTLRSAGSISVVSQDVANFIGGTAYVNVSPLAATALSVVGGGGAIGVARPLIVTARDTFGNVPTGYNGTVHFTSTDAAATLPPDTTLVNGTATVSVTLMTVGSQSITATDVNDPTLSGTDLGVQAAPAALASFDVVGFPASTAGVAGSFTVVARDTLGHVASNFTGTVYFWSSDGQASLPLSYTFTAADGGVHAFTATLKTAGTQSISAYAYAEGVGGTQTGIAVTAAAATTFSVNGPISSVAGTSQTITVTARDAFGNVATSYAGTVQLLSVDAQAVLPAAYAFTTADRGTHAFAITLKTSGSQSVTATDTATASIVGVSPSIDVLPAAVAGFTLNPPSKASVGVAFGVKVVAVDAYGNTVKNYAGTVHLTLNTSNAIVPADYTFSSADNGVHTFTITINTTGTFSIAVNDRNNSSLKAIASISVQSASGGGGGTSSGGGTSTGGGGGSGGGGKKTV